jgi:4-amino-4-deoxy-L-arabinose transferase-like glycosyltransferase
VLLAGSAALLTLWSLAVPIFEAPDEPLHWQVARYLHEMHRLPFYDSRLVEANQPPLYYVLIAPFATDSEAPSSAVYIDAQGRVIPFQAPKFYRNSKDDFAKYWPIRISRLVTALFSVLTVLFCYLSGVEATGNRTTGLLAGGLTALLPQFTFRGMNISNDALVATTSAAAVYLIVRLARRGFTWPLGWATAAVIGLASLSKISAIFLPLPFALAVVSEPAPWPRRLRQLSVLALSLLLVGPWLLRNQFLYGDPLASQQMFVAVPGLIDIKPITSPYFLTAFPSMLMKSFVGVFGWMNLSLPEPLYKFFGLLAAVAVLGHLWRLIRRRFHFRLILILTTVVLFTVLLTVHLNLTFTQPQGRYLFPALTALALLVAIGLEGLPNWGRNWTYATLAVVALVNLYSLIRVVLPSYWTL